MNEILREMKPEEKKEVKALRNRAFPFLLRFFFYFTKHVLVVEAQGKIVGAVLLKIFSYKRNKKSGLIAFIFSSPEAKGRGIGKKLAEGGIKSLEDKGCTEVFAMVEGDNTSSSKLFSNRDFRLLSFIEQIKLYGLKIFHVWFYTYHMFDIGCFMWVKTDEQPKKSRVPSFLLTVILQVLIYFITLIRRGYELNGSLIIATVLCISVILIIRTLVMYLSAKAQKLDVEYRMWESSLFLNLSVSTLFAGCIPSPGSLYPKKENWTYRDYRKQLGIMGLCSSIVLVLLTAGVYAVLSLKLLPNLGIELNMIYNFLMTFLIFDIVFPIFPFSQFNGGRVWNWNKLVWGLTVIPVVLLIIF